MSSPKLRTETRTAGEQSMSSEISNSGTLAVASAGVHRETQRHDEYEGHRPNHCWIQRPRTPKGKAGVRWGPGRYKGGTNMFHDALDAAHTASLFQGEETMRSGAWNEDAAKAEPDEPNPAPIAFGRHSELAGLVLASGPTLKDAGGYKKSAGRKRMSQCRRRITMFCNSKEDETGRANHRMRELGGGCSKPLGESGSAVVKGDGPSELGMERMTSPRTSGIRGGTMRGAELEGAS
ncbi:hypothetical protein B0H17DRAFT_1177716 [Mycena rosella]|uniref:Uncharacterized protein n=1 Tax=Mycena rosella TaxID=1033263 RepID=A0AAD7DQD2_MYCRO|nr:hypothetical protein B0H17DRAFT_1177716 [Mycena rosella]